MEDGVEAAVVGVAELVVDGEGRDVPPAACAQCTEPAPHTGYLAPNPLTLQEVGREAPGRVPCRERLVGEHAQGLRAGVQPISWEDIRNNFCADDPMEGLVHTAGENDIRNVYITDTYMVKLDVPLSLARDLSPPRSCHKRL
ncbi:MAG: hypothetical protein EP343_00555 [Deltaproteobacteria bacterium]|nr:MAG: hypothetical protein EP343_00555 [Deltaproteobacteria bacterium]